MATATKVPGKTSFVRAFLQDNPQANAKAVNEAWAAARMKGTISHPVISEVRKLLGLTTDKPGTKKKAARGKAAKGKPTPGTSKTATVAPGKTMFVKEFLNDHPDGNVNAVNEAWKSAGFDGTVSLTLVDKLRSKMGLTGNLGRKTKTSRKAPAGKKRGRPRKETTGAAIVSKPQVSRFAVLEDLETEIDQILFRVMGIGGLTEIEDTLRRARRLLYGASNRG